jgi:hypothetical protein
MKETGRADSGYFAEGVLPKRLFGKFRKFLERIVSFCDSKNKGEIRWQQTKRDIRNTRKGMWR